MTFKRFITSKKLVTALVMGLCVMLAGGSLLVAGEKKCETKCCSTKAYLGVAIDKVSQDNKKELGAEFGVLVKKVSDDSAAEKAGIKKGDVIQFYNGKKTDTPKSLIKAVAECKAGDKAKVKLVRNKKKMALKVTLGEKKKRKYFTYHIDEEDEDGHHNITIKKMKKLGKLGNLGKLGKLGKGGFLGITIAILSDEKMKKLGVKNGILVTGVSEDSAAEKAGIKEKDVIISFNGEKTEKVGAFIKAVRKCKPGSDAKIKLVRNKKEMTVKAKLGESKKLKHLSMFLGEDGDNDHNVIIKKFGKGHFGSRGFLGVQLQPLDDLSDYFGVKAGEGVLITKVSKETPAAKGGLKAGDVIVKMDDKKINKSKDIHKFLRAWKEGEKVAVHVVRHKKKKTLNIEPEIKKLSFNKFFKKFNITEDGDSQIHIEMPQIHIDTDHLKECIIIKEKKRKEHKELLEEKLKKKKIKESKSL